MALPQYTTGYSIGVGGIVCHEGRVLFVKGASEYSGGWWHLPGGFVEKNESIESAVLREVSEETGIECEVIGIAGIRHKLFVEPTSNEIDENSIYVIFKLRPNNPSALPQADGIEIAEAKFLSIQEVEELTPCSNLFKTLAKSALAEQGSLLAFQDIAGTDKTKYQLYF